jgi:hypothetical protein
MRLGKVRRDLHRIVYWKLMVPIQLVPERLPRAILYVDESTSSET